MWQNLLWIALSLFLIGMVVVKISFERYQRLGLLAICPYWRHPYAIRAKAVTAPAALPMVLWFLLANGFLSMITGGIWILIHITNIHTGNKKLRKHVDLYWNGIVDLHRVHGSPIDAKQVLHFAQKALEEQGLIGLSQSNDDVVGLARARAFSTEFLQWGCEQTAMTYCQDPEIVAAMAIGDWILLLQKAMPHEEGIESTYASMIAARTHLLQAFKAGMF